jgi:phosphatidylglycerol---prolipoprotein diacylglyceryl transferase
MRPILFSLGGWPVPAYGLTLALLMAGGLLLLWRQTRPLGLTDTHMLDLAVIAVAAVGLWVAAGHALARLGWAGPMHLSALPVLTLGAGGFLAYLRAKRLPAEAVFDKIAPLSAFALGVQFGFGTLLAGTAFGWPTRLPWGLSFPPGSPAYRAFGAAPLHPTQLYLGIGFLAIAAAAWHLGAAARPGTAALRTFVAMTLWYLMVSPLRAMQSWATGQPRVSDLVALSVVSLCAAVLWQRRRG